MPRTKVPCDVPAARANSGNYSKYQSAGNPDNFDIDFNNAMAFLVSIDQTMSDIQTNGGTSC